MKNQVKPYKLIFIDIFVIKTQKNIKVFIKQQNISNFLLH